jgi:hypothetical protein
MFESIPSTKTEVEELGAGELFPTLVGKKALDGGSLT